MRSDARHFFRDPIRFILGMLWYGQSREITDHAGETCRCFSPSLLATGKDAGTGNMTEAEYREFVRRVRRRHSEAAMTRFVGVAMALVAFFEAGMVSRRSSPRVSHLRSSGLPSRLF